MKNSNRAKEVETIKNKKLLRNQKKYTAKIPQPKSLLRIDHTKK